MEKGLKAFFYDYKYYLLPDEFQSVEALKEQKVVEVKRLKEELCMAPDFIYESIETELLTIEAPERVFPAEVNLYTSKEYDEILRKQVDVVCQNCERYVDDGDESLDGHHREISLDGVCYLKRTEEEYWSFSRCARAAWYWIAQRTDELEKCIDENNQDKIQEIVAEELDKFFLPNKIYGGVDENGKYFLAFYACDYGVYGIKNVLGMLAYVANHETSPMAEAGWKVYPFLPKGMLPTTKTPDYITHPPRFFMNVDEDTEGVNLCVYEPDLAASDEETELRIRDALYEYVCYCVGEDTLLAGCDSYEVVDEIPEGMAEATAQEVEEALLKRARPENMTESIFPAHRFRDAYEEGTEPEMLPFKKGLQFAMTVCPEMGPEKLDESKEGGNTMFEDFGIVYAYLYLPNGNEVDVETKRDVLLWYLNELDQYPEPINDKDSYGYIAPVGWTVTAEGLCNDAMVFDEKAFFRWMRHLTPVLKGLNVKIVTVKRSGTVVYEPDYRIAAEGSDWLN